MIQKARHFPRTGELQSPSPDGRRGSEPAAKNRNARTNSRMRRWTFGRPEQLRGAARKSVSAALTVSVAVFKISPTPEREAAPTDRPNPKRVLPWETPSVDRERPAAKAMHLTKRKSTRDVGRSRAPQTRGLFYALIELSPTNPRRQPAGRSGRTGSRYVRPSAKLAEGRDRGDRSSAPSSSMDEIVVPGMWRFAVIRTQTIGDAADRFVSKAVM